MSQDQLDIMEELEFEVAACEDPSEKEELQRTLEVCREMAYALAEGLVECEEDEDGELMFFPVEA